MPVVKNIVKDASGAILDGIVTIDLIVFDGGAPVSFQGFIDIPADTTSDYTINIPATTQISNGAWSMTLKGNSDIGDAYGSTVSTYYRVQEVTATVNRTYYIEVPSSGGPYWVGSIGALDPTVIGSSFTLDSLTDVITSGATNGQSLVFNTSTGLWGPGTAGINASGSWTPVATGPATMPATWTGVWEQVNNKTYHIAIAAAVTGTWSGLTTATLSATLPSSWARHANKTMHLAGHATSGASNVYWNVLGVVEPISKSNTAPTVRFLTPSITTSAYNYNFVNGVGTPFTFASGYSLEVSGVIRVA